MKLRCAPTPVRLHRGFTLVEIMVAVVILGVLITIAVPTYRHFQRKAQNTTFINNLRIFTQSFETYAMKYGNWPSDTAAGVIPVDAAGHSMSGEFRDADWIAATPVGGLWKWNYSTSAHPRASISVVGATADDAQMKAIDLIIDDGDLTTGIFKGGSGTFTFTVQN